MWEQEPAHDRYGTPMAMMLLPFWTNGCIGSMEGLYFEASAHHALPLPQPGRAVDVAIQRPARPALRAGRAQPRRVQLGVQHLQMLGVKYYMAISAG